jgi:rod shape-determining protein MreB
MVVDVGGGTTEIAVISLGGIVVSKSLRIAGDEMDSAIAHYIRLRHGLILGEKTSEDLKIKIGSAYQNQKSKIKSQKSEEGGYNSGFTVHDSEGKQERMAVVRGRDIETGLPKSLRVTEVEVREALSPVLSKLLMQLRLF